MAKEDTTMTTWIPLFQTFLETAVDPATEAKLKQEYITWLNQRGSYYSSLSKVCPEFLDVLNVLEGVIGVQVKIEEPKKSDKKEVKESTDGEEWTGPIEAKGTKGLNAAPWQKSFKNVAAMDKWVEANDATVDGVRESDPQYTREKKAAARLNKEDLDTNTRLDEISKKTLGSYVKKAADSMADATWAKAKAPKDRGNSKPGESEFDKNDNTMVKREKGIAKAVDKLTSEAKVDASHTFQVGDVVEVIWKDIAGETKQGTTNIDTATSAYATAKHPSIDDLTIKVHQGINGKGGMQTGTNPGTRAGGYKFVKSEESEESKALGLKLLRAKNGQRAANALANEGWEADLAKKNRERMKAEKDAAKADARIKDREAKYLAGTEKKATDSANLSRVFQDIEMAVGDSFPDGDPMDVLMRKYKDRYGDLDIDLLNKAAKANGAKDYHSYVANVWKQYMSDNPDLVQGGNPFESYTNAISKMLGEAKDTSGDVQVVWTNRDYKEQTKTFKNDPKGAPENAMVKAKAFKEKLDKDEDVRSINIKWVK